MISVIKVSNGVKAVIVSEDDPAIRITKDGEIQFRLRKGDGRAADIIVQMSPSELKSVRDSANKAIEKLTGQKIVTSYH